MLVFILFQQFFLRLVKQKLGSHTSRLGRVAAYHTVQLQQGLGAVILGDRHLHFRVVKGNACSKL